jgi:methanogenic corrinoid protein MtbC1
VTSHQALDPQAIDIDTGTARGERPAASLSIGALSRAAGIPVETLRTWEARYGFPVANRKPSGHRYYPATIVPRLRKIAEALAQGHRAAETVTASDDGLSLLLRTRPRTGGRSAAVREAAAQEDLPDIVRAVTMFDAAGLRSRLEADWARMGVLDFVTNRVGPLLTHVGEGWRTGTLQIRHEHFLSEQLSELLRTFRMLHESKARGPLAIFATLPGESHGLGLQMAALVGAAAGFRVIYLGTDVPVAQIAELALDTSALAVALSVSSASDPAGVARLLTELRGSLPSAVELVVGGDGAPTDSEDARVLPDFDALRRWCENRAADTR